VTEPKEPRDRADLGATLGEVCGMVAGLLVAAVAANGSSAELGPMLSVGMFALIAVGTVAVGTLCGALAGVLIGRLVAAPSTES
jgi:hypothetical protein